MAPTSAQYHEPLDSLSKETRDMHRALVSIQEELEAVDWYRQRADACSDEELRDVLLHNMREEIEHATMLIEWLRRNSSDFGENLDLYLFSNKPITEIEEEEEKGEALDDADHPGSSGARVSTTTIGSLKGGSK